VNDRYSPPQAPLLASRTAEASSSKAALYVAIASSTLLVAVLAIVGIRLNWTMASGQPPGFMSTYDPHCHPAMSYQSGVWADDGWEGTYLTCAKSQGRVFIWRGDHLAIEGNYENGLKDGTFVYYRDDGSIEKRVEFRAGKEVKPAD